MTWILTRDDTKDLIELHSQFVWVDEHTWQALAQSDPAYTLTGAAIIEQSIKKGGRPITLNGDNALIRRDTLETLKAWANTPALTLTLTHPKGQEYAVIFSRPAVSEVRAFGRQLRAEDSQEDDKLHVNLHFLTA